MLPKQLIQKINQKLVFSNMENQSVLFLNRKTTHKKYIN